MNDRLAVVVEDDPIIADIFATALSRAGYCTQILRDGQAALDQVPGLAPDLVILDLHLPLVPGLQVLRELRSNAGLSQTRIVVVSADATLTQSLRDQADLVLVKPVGFHQLRELGEKLRTAGK